MDAHYGRYRIVEELGKGAMGVVYKAHDPQIDRMIALKVLRSDRVTSEAFVARFLKEARAIGRLSHPHIVTIYDAGEDQGTIYIAMEYLEGVPLNEVIRNDRPDAARGIDLARRIALTLDYAHRQGIVHRDIKPSNILITAEGQVKLTDFGIARIEEAAAGQETQAGEILGTPLYMSPEQVMGQSVDGRSDLFSLGVILYEMVVGRRPFSGDSIAAIFHAITRGTPEAPEQVDPFLPKSLSGLILKSLAKDPADRFQTGEQMAAALAEALAALKAPTGKTEAPRQRATSRRLVPALGLLLVVLLVAGGYWAMGRQASTSAVDRAASAPPANAAAGNNATPLQAAELSLLKVASEPPGADIYVDEGHKGRTPMDLALPEGKYELRLNLEGYLEWQAQVQVDAEGETPLNITLWPKQ